MVVILHTLYTLDIAFILDVGFDATSRYPREREREGDISCRPLPTSQRDTVMGTYNTNRRIKDIFILKDTLAVPGGSYVVITFPKLTILVTVSFTAT